MLQQPILIIDAYNCFMRGYCAYPAMNQTTGEHVGGVVGFVKTLKRMVEDIQPTEVYVIWEGGGSSKRRSLYSEYKANRKPGKLNRFYEDDIPDSVENKLQQVTWLIKVLKQIPVCQLYVSDVEADDVIAYLTVRKFADENKVILSTDKDMYQLLNEQTHVYDLNKKAYVTPETVKEKYFIPPRNFALAKTLSGDGSDNIKGVKGLGFKTVAKRFPLLLEDKDVLLQDVIGYAQSRVDEAPIYRSVALAESLLKTNWRLVYLDGSMLSSDNITRLDSVIEKFVPNSDKMELIRVAMECGVANHIDVSNTLYALKSLNYTHNSRVEKDV